jgi:hypothetical protein
MIPNYHLVEEVEVELLRVSPFATQYYCECSETLLIEKEAMT